MEFKEYKLKSLTLRITKGTTPKRTDGYINYGINYIKSESLNYMRSMDISKFAHISESVHKGYLKRSILKENDILYSIAGANLGKSGIVKKEYLPANTNQAVAIISIDQKKANHKYIYYYISNPIFVKWANSIVSQSAQPNLNLDNIGNFTIKLPSLDIQNKIVKILFDIDKKIELNNQTNDNLHEIIINLYNEKIKNNANVYFESKSLDEFCNIFTGKKNANENDENGNCKFFTCAPEPLKINTFIYDGPAVIISGNGAYTGRIIFYNGKFDLYQRTYGCTIKDDINKDYIYLIYAIIKSDLEKTIMGGTHGSAIPYIVMDDISKFKFKYNKVAFDNLSNKIKPMLKKIKESEKQNEILSQLRDTLLPKLINGEINVENVEV